VGPLVVRPDLEGRQGAGGGLLEDEGDVEPGHPLALGARALVLAQLRGQVDDREELVLGEVGLFQQVSSLQVHDCYLLGFRGQAGSRCTGQVMHRGPPRPRPSSLPPMSTTSMPCLRSMVLVGILRS
jgi:hypothetical protein